jgi:hypothetical protein
MSTTDRPAPPYFSTLTHKWHDFRENVTEHKACVVILSKRLSARRDIINVHWYSRIRYSCQIFMKLGFSRQSFPKIINYQISWNGIALPLTEFTISKRKTSKSQSSPYCNRPIFQYSQKLTRILFILYWAYLNYRHERCNAILYRSTYILHASWNICNFTLLVRISFHELFNDALAP